MKLSILLGCVFSIAFGLGPVTKGAFAGDMKMPVSAFLCDTSLHAVQFADVKAQGEGDEIAQDRVGRMAKAAVCGRYAGIATIESESVTLQNGVAYKLTAFRFTEDHKVAWMAETSFAPPVADWQL